MSKYTWKNLIEEVLNETSPLSTEKIWARANQLELTKKLTGLKTDKATFDGLRGTIYGDTQNWLGRVEGDTLLFFLKQRKSSARKDSEGTSKPQKEYKESDMHSLLTYFVHSNEKFFGSRPVYTKTIKHSPSVKYGKKQHPDMVGVYLPFPRVGRSSDGGMYKDVIDLNQALNARFFYQIFSFELKLEINSSNYSEIFYQVINNSTWANQSYLVVAEINGGKKQQEILDELTRLNHAHGIGVVLLKHNDVDQSDVLFPARSRDELDWVTINKLYRNSDFKDFIERVRIDANSRKIDAKSYDKVKNPNK